MAPLERPEEEDDDEVVGDEVDVVVEVEDSTGDEEVAAELSFDSLCVLLVGVEELDVLLLEGASLPTAGGPSVLPSRSCAACLILSAVSPVRPEMLKRLE